ncbi:hypothetical protein VTL71DRAFT_13449 [Oculimacula yallundae]|uniref:Uncharacterized protein n=1 Tax=Oculimacula yallundae TaxID=86028 RepID=A0ABR4CKI2_9HELO
MAFLRDIP